jgi:hypothetical protein
MLVEDCAVKEKRNAGLLVESNEDVISLSDETALAVVPLQRGHADAIDHTFPRRLVLGSGLLQEALLQVLETPKRGSVGTEQEKAGESESACRDRDELR